MSRRDLSVEVLVCAGGGQGAPAGHGTFLSLSLHQRKQSLPRPVIHFVHYFLIGNENSSHSAPLSGTVGSDYPATAKIMLISLSFYPHYSSRTSE